MHIASFVRCLFKSLAHVLTGLSVFILLTWKVVYMFWMQMQHTGSASYLLLVMTRALENNSSTVFSLVFFLVLDSFLVPLRPEQSKITRKKTIVYVQKF